MKKNEHDIEITAETIKFGSKIFYIKHISSTDITPIPKERWFNDQFLFGAIAVFIFSILTPIFLALELNLILETKIYIISSLITLGSGLITFIGLKQLFAKSDHALDILYDGSNKQLFVNSERDFIEEVQSTLNDAINNRMKKNTYIFDNRSNTVKVGGDVIGSTISGGDIHTDTLSVGGNNLEPITELLDQLKDIVEKHNSYALSAMHEHFQEEALKKKPNTNKLKQLWDQMILIASDLTKITDLFQKIFT